MPVLPLPYLLMCTIFGTTYLAIKVGIAAGLPPLLFAALRFAVAGPVTLGIVLLRRLPLPKRPAQYAALAVVGLCSTTLVYATLFWAEQYLSSSLAAILLAASPLLVMVIRSKWNQFAWRTQVAGLVAGLLGVALAVLPQLRSGVGPATLVASALLLLSGLSLAFGSVRSRAVMEQGVHPLTLNALQMLFGGLGLLLCSLLFESPAQVSFNPPAWAALTYLSIIGSVLGFGIYYWLVAKTGPLFASTWTYVAPVIATLAGTLLLGEPAGWPVVAGLLLVLAGAGMTDPEGLRRLLKR